MKRLSDFQGGCAVFRAIAPAAVFATAFAAALATTPARALDVKSEKAAIGVWRLNQGADRVCIIRLLGEEKGRIHLVGMPSSCRLAMPALSNVIGWKLASPGHIDFLDRDGGAVLSFVAGDGGLDAKGPNGESFVLAAVNVADKGRGPQAREGRSAASSAGPSVSARELPGRYSVLRDIDKDTGCMLTLHAGGKAQLGPACRDNGIVVFDPVGWSYAGGKLVLRARKGHHVSFEYTSDESWQKDSREGGRKLGFRKM
ncbi:MAG: AprI/Inh family metalloprotease inhibitor [Rhodoblastus sp.]